MGEIESRIGLCAPAHIYRPDTDFFCAIGDEHVKSSLSAIFVDEAQFLSERQVWQLAQVGDELNLPVLCYGLRTDFQGKPFEGSAALLAIADNLREARTICFCGRKATMTARIDHAGKVITKGAQVDVGKDAYQSFCRKHWREALAKAD